MDTALNVGLLFHSNFKAISGLERENASVKVPYLDAAVKDILTVPPAQLAFKERTELSEIQSLASIPVKPIRQVGLESKTPMSIPANVMIIPLYGAALDFKINLTEGQS
jgi:hypothetical protein